MNLILILITIVAIIFSIYCIKNKIEIDNVTIEQNKQIHKENDELQNRQNVLQKNIVKSQEQYRSLQTKIEDNKEHLNTIQNELTNSLKNQKNLSQEAFDNFIKILENQYKEAEKEYNSEIDTLNDAYSKVQLKLIQKQNEYQEELDKIKATRDAAIDAIRREKEIEDNLSFYCIEISDADKADIAKLETLKPSLNKPRVLSMLIWQTWFRDSLKSLSANVIGQSDKTGIYKITNIKTKECYIGQAVNIKDRWVEHAKCGLGIDTPAGNKLYKAIQNYGLWNFSFEILEECTKEQLNEKEKYYIDLYNSYNYGYNANKGVSK